MKIKMLTDFRGRETNERYYQAGQVVEIDDDIAARLIADNRAEAEQDQAQEPQQDKPQEKKGRRK